MWVGHGGGAGSPQSIGQLYSSSRSAHSPSPHTLASYHACIVSSKPSSGAGRAAMMTLAWNKQSVVRPQVVIAPPQPPSCCPAIAASA